MLSYIVCMIGPRSASVEREQDLVRWRSCRLRPLQCRRLPVGVIQGAHTFRPRLQNNTILHTSTQTGQYISACDCGKPRKRSKTGGNSREDGSRRGDYYISRMFIWNLSPLLPPHLKFIYKHRRQGRWRKRIVRNVVRGIGTLLGSLSTREV